MIVPKLSYSLAARGLAKSAQSITFQVLRYNFDLSGVQWFRLRSDIREVIELIVILFSRQPDKFLKCRLYGLLSLDYCQLSLVGDLPRSSRHDLRLSHVLSVAAISRETV
jgi:hypothetical protein